MSRESANGRIKPVAEKGTIQRVSYFYLCQYVKERFSEWRVELARTLPSAEFFEAKPQRASDLTRRSVRLCRRPPTE